MWDIFLWIRSRKTLGPVNRGFIFAKPSIHERCYLPRELTARAKLSRQHQSPEKTRSHA
jgi:hypothetical protein